MTPRRQTGRPSEKVLVVNADDFGMSRGVNRGIVRAHREGIVTSASLMVFRPAAADAAAQARRFPKLGLGLHVELGSWRRRAGEWTPEGHVVATDDGAAVEAAVVAQLERFVRLTGRAVTHLDSHQHRHLQGAAREVLAGFGRRLGVPVRGLTPGVNHRGDFYGQDRHGDSHPEWISSAALIELLEAVPVGVTELTCHPGRGIDAPDGYARERPIELASLCDPDAARAIERCRIHLRSFAGIWAPGREHALERTR